MNGLLHYKTWDSNKTTANKAHSVLMPEFHSLWMISKIILYIN